MYGEDIQVELLKKPYPVNRFYKKWAWWVRTRQCKPFRHEPKRSGYITPDEGKYFPKPSE